MLPRGLVQTLSWFGLFLVAGGGCSTIWAIRTAGLARLLGRPTSGPPLLLRGPYRFVRYPACSGLLAFSLGLLLWRPAWITAAVFLAALVGGKIWIALEERKCLARFGEAYRRYRAAVPALLPLRLRPRSLKADS